MPLPVALSGDGTYAGPVTVTLTALPSGVSVAPLTLVPGASGTLFVSASVAAGQEFFPANSPSNANTVTVPATVTAFAGMRQALATFSLTISLENDSFSPQSDQINLPVVRINTGGVPIADKTTSVPGSITISSADGQTLYLPGAAGSDNTAIFHLHGNTTLLMPKKPYDLKLNTGTDLLTGMGLKCPYVTSSGKAACDKSKSYILLANYDDKTLLRDWAASALANAIPIGGSYLSEASSSPSPSGNATLLPWAPHSLFVELYLNGQYEGNYQLIEAVTVDSHRLNLSEMAQTDVSGSAQTGGYLLEIDQHRDEDYTFVTPEGVDVGLLDPDYTPEVPEQTSYITTYVDTAEAALFSPNFTDPALGWRAFFDQAAAVNYYIVNDVMGNVDGGDFYSSTYLYKDRKNPLLYMGPIWDFDISSGNVNYESILDPTLPWVQTKSPWYARWFADPSFKAAAQQQWNALKNNGVLSSWLASIAQQAAALQQSQQNNFGRWPMQGIRVWPNPEAPGSYQGEVNYLLDWITLRMGYMDAFLNHTPATSISISVPSGTLRSGTPVTLMAQVTGNNPTGTVTFSVNAIVIGQAALDGTGSASFTTSTLPAEAGNIEAYYNGDAKNAFSVNLGPHVTILPRLVETAANLTSSGEAQYSQPVTLTAAAVGVSGAASPSGTFTFTSSGAYLGSAPVSSMGVATFTTSALTAGDSTIQASYSGDQTYAPTASNVVPVKVNPAVATVTLAAGSATYNGSPQAVSVTTEPAGLSVDVRYNGSSTPPAAAGSYTVAATINDPNYAGSATGTLVVTRANATVALGNLNVSYSGSSQPATATTQPSGLGIDITYNGVATPPTATGSYKVVATINDPNYAGSAAGTLVVTRANATVTLGNLNVSYSGSSQPATATTQPSGLGIDITYNGVATPPTATGSYKVVATINDPNYAGSAAGTLVIAKTVAALTLGSLGATYDGGPHPVSVQTQPAGLQVSLSYAGAAAAPSAAGTYSVTATIEDSNYTGSATGTLVVAQGHATVMLSGLDAVFDGSSRPVTAATAPSGLSVDLTYGGSSAAPNSAGTYTIVATVNDPNYTGSATGTLVVAKGTVSLRWPEPADITYGTALSSLQLDAAGDVLGTISYNPPLGTMPAAGTQMLSATWHPADSADYNSISRTVQITVDKQSSTVTLAVSPSEPVPNQVATLTAIVAPAAAGSPTGSVAFLDGTTLLGTRPLSGGAATYAATLASGSHTLFAIYSGDQNFAGSQSSQGGTIIAVTPLDFTLSNTGAAAQTVTVTQPAIFDYSVVPLYGSLPGAVSFTITGLPSGLYYSLSQTPADTQAGGQKVRIAIAESVASARTISKESAARGRLWALSLLVLPFARKRRSKRLPAHLLSSFLLLAGTGVALMQIAGCGTQSEAAPAAASYGITLTATSGTMQHSATLSLTVEQPGHSR